MRDGRGSDDTVAARWVPNFDWITDRLAVGGSFPAERAELLARDHGIKAVVDLRSEEQDDEAILRRHGVTFLHLPTRDLCAVDLGRLDDGVAFALRHLGRGERVLVHCEHGIGRSATLALCILVADGLPPLEALDRAKSRRALISPSPAQFECWVSWLRGRRAAQGGSWDLPEFDAFKAIAYRHLPAGA